MKQCIRCFVAGKVQGVWFRASTKEEADKLSLTGWVRNLPDSRVEVVACGEQDAIEAMKSWLHIGPSGAQVSEVIADDIDWQEFEDFDVRL